MYAPYTWWTVVTAQTPIDPNVARFAASILRGALHFIFDSLFSQNELVIVRIRLCLCGFVSLTPESASISSTDH
jgi:hypothetical protein